FRTQLGAADDVAVLPGFIAQTIKKVRFAAAIFADDQFETGAAVAQIAAQVFVFERLKQRIDADAVGFESARRRDARFAEFADDVLRFRLRERHRWSLLKKKLGYLAFSEMK